MCISVHFFLFVSCMQQLKRMRAIALFDLKHGFFVEKLETVMQMYAKYLT